MSKETKRAAVEKIFQDFETANVRCDSANAMFARTDHMLANRILANEKHPKGGVDDETNK